MKKKKLIILGIGLLFFVALISYLGVIKPSPISSKPSNTTQTTKQNALKIAVVNEDSGVIYNGEPVKIGDTLINAFSANSNYDVELVSRSLAEKGLENNTYQLMLILPSKFSQDSLSLEATDPQQAIFQYQIKSDKQLVARQAEQAVTDLKSFFNKELINIYFLSIIGNLQTAQSRVGEVVSNENRTLDSFNLRLTDPLNTYSQQFNGLSSPINDILSSYDIFNRDLNNSNDAFTAIINTDRTYDSELETIKSLQEQWQVSIDAREDSLNTYDNNLSQLSVEEQLAQLENINATLANTVTNATVWEETKGNTEQFNVTINELLEELKTQNDEIDSTLTNYDQAVADAVKASIESSDGDINGDQSVINTLGLYVASINAGMTNKVNKKLTELVYFDDAAINRMDLSDSDKQYLKNINAFVTWYTIKNNIAAPAKRETTIQDSQLVEVKNATKAQLGQQHQISFVNLKGDIKKVILTAPENYRLNISNQSAQLEGNTYIINVPENTKEAITINYSIAPANENEIDIFEPVEIKVDVETIEKLSYFEEDETVEKTTTSDVSSQNSGETSDSNASAGNESDKTTTESNDVPGTGETNTESSSDGSTQTGETNTSDASSQTDSSTGVETSTQTEPVVTYKKSEKEIDRVYSKTNVHFPYQQYSGKTKGMALYEDIRSYLELSGLVQAFYDIDLAKGALSADSITVGKETLIGQTEVDNLKEIIVKLLKDATITSLKDNLKITDEKLNDFEALKAKSDALNSSVVELQETTAQLTKQLTDTMATTKLVQEQLTNKPEIVSNEKRDNTDMVTVSLDINKDLVTLLSASRTLVDNTKSNQLVSDNLQRNISQVNNDINSLEREGQNLSTQVADLKAVMTREYGSNEEFLKSFATVLNNTKTGNEKNSAVYEYLSDPVNASKIETVLGTITEETATARQDERSSLLLVFISYLASLVIVYFMQHTDISQLQKQFKMTDRVHWKNATGPLAFLTGMGVSTALLIAVISGLKLSLKGGEIMMLFILMMVTTLLFTYGINLLIQKIKSFGFLISLLLLMLYIVTATQLLDAYYVTNNTLITSLSPLTHIEEMLTSYINHSSGWGQPLVVILLATLVFAAFNLFTYNKVKES
ncbi:type VII secretion protein EsaA [Streptococcus sp. CSL10205-OR2]|uniref:type VII secretion protein EsaA n=1 Tax=Streptococcus sp. CSL10205-OR2 TaxID=2980558 RepID=UPI0021D89146|nr:type VII secretion protein EsaA [Streptococcus sp. CSL10205-OR2]MCU9533509.1 type VII secretion protein EsaA [Streptococcus sp. CSL10205-OR2]